MSNWFEQSTAKLDRALVWIGAVGLLWAALSWLGKQLTALGSPSWPEAIFIGLAATALLSLAVSGLLAAWRYFRPLPPLTQITGSGEPSGNRLTAVGTVRDVPIAEQMERDIYVGQIVLDGEKLTTTHAVEIAVIAFNGTDRILSLAHLRGAIHLFLNVKNDKREEIVLSPPSILSDRTNLDLIADHSEFMIVLEQALKPDLVQLILQGLDQGPVTFDFDDLHITLRDASEGTVARLKLWGGASLIKDGRIRTGKLHKLQANSIVVGQPSAESAA